MRNDGGGAQSQSVAGHDRKVVNSATTVSFAGDAGTCRIAVADRSGRSVRRRSRCSRRRLGTGFLIQMPVPQVRTRRSVAIPRFRGRLRTIRSPLEGLLHGERINRRRVNPAPAATTAATRRTAYLKKRFITLMAPGPRITTNKAGRIMKIVGNRSFIGTF